MKPKYKNPCYLHPDKMSMIDVDGVPMCWACYNELEKKRKEIIKNICNQ